MSLEFYHITQRKARKEHSCEMCYDKIVVGELYHHEVGKYDGDFFDRKLHTACQKVLREAMDDMKEDEYDYEMIADWWHDKYCFNCKLSFPECEPDSDVCPHQEDCPECSEGRCHANGRDCDKRDKVCWCTLYVPEET